ncbi:MAG TPA: prolyl oligopeptidase family serine peptidase [Sphingomicrobium sp.]|nr:prolyl oligopeptidase family serine peptidase [Sphingomicrobium sp.]
MRKPLVLFTIAAAAVGLSGVKAATGEDSYLWLEDVSSPRALQWVEAHNAKSTSVLQADPRYDHFYRQALDIAQAKDRIPVGAFIGGQIYNFWQDEDHVRGIWRRATPDSYATGNPQWETVLDLDALAHAEKANWVWKGAPCARPSERRCLVSLSDGGEDAVTVREFDLPTKSFVKGGFFLPKGKQRVDWQDENTLLVSREWKKGDLGRTGYPFIAKRLRRGQPLAAAVEVYRGSPKDGGYGVTPFVLRDGENRTLAVVDRPLDTFNHETYVLTPKGARRVGIPAKSDLSDLVAGRVIIHNREDWMVAGKRFPAGSVLSVDLAQLKADPAHPRPRIVYAPAARESLQGVSSSKDVLLVDILDNVRGRTLAYRPVNGGGWNHAALALPENSTVAIASTSSTDNRALISVANFLTPPSLWLADGSTGEARQIMQQPPKFDASRLVAEQREAVSSDGTRVPYFLVHRKDMRLDGNNPTLLYAYGGFEVSQTPSYSAITGKLWLENGGVYALANIRGGGEFGPAWHEAGLGTKRQIVYDDFAAVAKDLISSKVTSPRRLGIRGGSNGGLLMGVEFTQHPDLWNAVVIDVPLLDMIRISKIAAGASWEGEYGSIDDPAVRAFWEKVSPYQNLRANGRYPTPFIFTTTKDDRVGPQHARKFAARMEEMGLPFYYYENTEGGHAAGANLRQTAHTNALEMTYLTRKLMDPVEPK